MVALNEIERFARDIGREFKPDRVVLFGSYVSGEARDDSDVDLLVTMDYRGNSRRVAAEIIRRLKPRFAVDLVIRSEHELQERLRNHDFFLMTATEQGRLLYEASDG